MALTSWTPLQAAAAQRAVARAVAGDDEHIADEDRCVNYDAAAVECTGRAGENGWCPGCWAALRL